jgi:hypothetical protein
MKCHHRCVAALLIAVVTAMALLAPMRDVQAASGQFQPRWTTWPASAMTTVRYPLDNWSLLGEIAGRGSGGFDIRMLQGERWITAGREEVGQLGLGSEMVSKLMTAFPGHAAIVFATYSPENAQLRIRVVKAERHPDGRVRTFLADFTPHHGERWAAQRQYLTVAEAADTTRAGRNPFASFRPADQTDPVFYNAGWSAAQVAVGHAMRLYNASAGFIALTDTRWNQTVRKSGNLFTQTVEVTTEAWVRPIWFVALPVDHQPYGVQTAICTIPGSTSCASFELLAQSGVSVSRWEGGNMPSPEDLLYSWTDSQSGFTVFAFALVTAAFVWAAASVVASYGLFQGVITTSGAGAMSPATLGLFTGGAYAASSTVFGGGGPITSAQEGYLGATGSGYLEVPASTDPNAFGLNEAISRRQIDGPISQSLTGTALVYNGGCAEDRSVEVCRSGAVNPGRIPRPDSLVRHNNVLTIRGRSIECRGQGLRGSDLARCASTLPR